MKNLTLCFFVVLSLNSIARGLEWIPPINLISSELDYKLSKNESQYVFKFDNISKHEGGTKIIYSIDSVTIHGVLDSNNKLSIKTLPGVHVFQFFYNDKHLEIYSDSLEILPQYTNTYQVIFQSSEERIDVSKPVIYLYPEIETEFSFKVDPKGEFTFTYPEYNEGWNGVIHPNGDIKIDNNMYNYLFWESNQLINLNLINTKKGSIVKGEESLTFLEKQLDQFGFNTKEKADFITFWAPQLQKNEFNYIHFVLNEEADMFAKLSLTPTPDHIYRFYILTSKIENPNEYSYLEQQVIQTVDRTGFTLLEWGGSEIELNTLKIKIL